MDKLRDGIERIIEAIPRNVLLWERGEEDLIELEIWTDTILDLIKQAGYVNLSEWLNEVAEGWVVTEVSPEYFETTKRKATRAEAMAGKATWVGGK